MPLFGFRRPSFWFCGQQGMRSVSRCAGSACSGPCVTHLSAFAHLRASVYQASDCRASAVPRARPCLGGGSSNGARGHKYRGDLRSAPTRPPPGPVAGRPSRPLYDDTGPFCPPIALGRAPGGGGSAAWAGGTIGASLAHGDLLNTCLGWPGTVGRPYSAAGLGSGGAPRPCGAAPRGDPTKRPSAGRCGTIGAIWRFRGVGPRV